MPAWAWVLIGGVGATILIYAYIAYVVYRGSKSAKTLIEWFLGPSP